MSYSDTKHVIEFTELGNERTAWECDCGAAGSAPDHTVDVAAERHVEPGEPVSYRYSGGAR